MGNFETTIRNTFDNGCIHDAEFLFHKLVENAFPTYSFRRLELIRFMQQEYFMEGRSLNHVFQIKRSFWRNSDVWEVHCRRVTSGKSPDKNVYLDYLSLNFVGYME